MVPLKMQVQFRGDLPVMGGKKANVDVHLQVVIQGSKPNEKGNLPVVSELTAIEMTLNGSPLPFTVKNVQAFFPKTTVELSPFGEVLKTDAPAIPLPIRLPGLDAKRFPEISYVPIALDPTGVELAKPYKFQRTFGGEPVNYIVTPERSDENSVEFEIELAQIYEALEDGKHNPTADDKLAVYKVTTQVKGKGHATFDRKLGRITLAHLEATATSQVRDFATDALVQPRSLETTLDIDSRPPPDRGLYSSDSW